MMFGGSIYDAVNPRKWLEAAKWRRDQAKENLALAEAEVAAAEQAVRSADLKSNHQS